MKPTVVVFDIGGVLIDWHPHLAWQDDLSEEEIRALLKRISFGSINLACAGGARLSDVAQDLSDPQDAVRLAQYFDNYARTVLQKIEGTWDILYALKAAQVPLYAITNWSGETWQQGCKAHPELLTVFEHIIVSGQEGIIKPSRAIYQLLCERAGIGPKDCVFIDDALHNCIAAKSAGMDAIHFSDACNLQKALCERTLL